MFRGRGYTDNEISMVNVINKLIVTCKYDIFIDIFVRESQFVINQLITKQTKCLINFNHRIIQKNIYNKLFNIRVFLFINQTLSIL